MEDIEELSDLIAFPKPMKKYQRRSSAFASLNPSDAEIHALHQSKVTAFPKHMRRHGRRYSTWSIASLNPTSEELRVLNQSISSSVSTLAEYSKFYEIDKLPEEILPKQNKDEIKRPKCVIGIDTNTDNFTERVKINISGRIFETYRYMLERFSDGVLGNKEKRKAFWDEARKEYYFDHSPNCFEGILQYYQSGILRLPQNTHLKSFIESLEYFQFSAETVDNFKKRECVLIDRPLELPKGRLKQSMWLLFEDPDSSRSAYLVEMFSVVVTLMSLSFVCWESVPDYIGLDCITVNTIVNHVKTVDEKPVFDTLFFLLEFICVMWFTLKLLLRFYSCPSKLNFIKSLFNIIDLISILPFYVILTYTVMTMNCPTAKGGFFLTLRALRVLRVFKLTRFSKGLRLLTESLKDCKRELFYILIVIIVGGFLFGLFLYLLEYDRSGAQINSIIDGYWWGVVTMTTVGYGDFVPVTFIGKIVGVACILTGIVILALPGPVITTSFNRYYRNETGRGFQDSAWIQKKN